MDIPEWRLILDSFYELVTAAEFDSVLSDDKRKQLKAVKQDIGSIARFIIDLSVERDRLREVEKAVTEFTDSTFEASWSDIPLEEAHNLMFRERIVLQGKLAQLKRNIPEWWDK